MRRLALTLALAGMLVVPAAASAHPSEGRNENGSAGPHCHINLMSGKNAYPSHKGHAAQMDHRPAGQVFQAWTECP
jgi:hypothetical protein